MVILAAVLWESLRRCCGNPCGGVVRITAAVLLKSHRNVVKNLKNCKIGNICLHNLPFLMNFSCRNMSMLAFF